MYAHTRTYAHITRPEPLFFALVAERLTPTTKWHLNVLNVLNVLNAVLRRGKNPVEACMDKMHITESIYVRKLYSSFSFDMSIKTEKKSINVLSIESTCVGTKLQLIRQ